MAMSIEDAFKKSLEYIKAVLEFLDKVKEKKLRKEKEDIVVSLRVFLEKSHDLIPPDSPDHTNEEEYVDVAQNNAGGDGHDIYTDTAEAKENTDGIYVDNEHENYVDNVVVPDKESQSKFSPSRKESIGPTPCEQLRDSSMSDFLDVKREKSLMMGAWMKRWCVVSGNVLFMYDSSKDKKQKEAIELNGYVVIVRDDITKESKRKDRCFELKHTQINKVYDFCAADRDVMYKWKESLEKASMLASSQHTRPSLSKSSPAHPSPSHGEKKKKNFAGMFSAPLKMMKKSNSESPQNTSISSADNDDVYVDNVEEDDQQLSIYTDTDAPAFAPPPDEEDTYDEVEVKQDRRLPSTPGTPVTTGSRQMPLPPQPATPGTMRPLPSEPPTPSYNRPLPSEPPATGPSRPLPSEPPLPGSNRPCPAEPNSVSFDQGMPRAPPRPSKSRQGSVSSPPPVPSKHMDVGSGSGTFRKTSRLPPTPTTDKHAFPPAPGATERQEHNEVVLNMEEDEAKYKDVSIDDLYQGMWDCSADDGNELSFKRGQIVHIISKEYDNHGWWTAQRDNEVGLVPKEYLMEAYEK